MGNNATPFWIITHVTLIPSKKWIQLNILKNLSNTQNIPLPQPPTTYEVDRNPQNTSYFDISSPTLWL